MEKVNDNLESDHLLINNSPLKRPAQPIVEDASVYKRIAVGYRHDGDKKEEVPFYLGKNSCHHKTSWKKS